MGNVTLLDCTLRDGGYVNNWRWGESTAKGIVRCLNDGGIDFIELGFLRDDQIISKDVTVCDKIEGLNALIPEGENNNVSYTAMIMNGGYDVSNLIPYIGNGINTIRVTAHEYDLYEGIELCRNIRSLGYRVCFNPINIMGYSDRELLQMLESVEQLHPWQFTIVDTFGSMRRRDMERIVRMADHNLSDDIHLGLHLHENMSLSFCLAQELLDSSFQRSITIDGSLMGIGRPPGNLPLELIADYLIENYESKYDLDPLMDAIQDYIAPMKGDCRWGYTPEYFLSARFNLHRNYAEYLIKRGDLTNRDMNHILSRVDKEKAAVYDDIYITELCEKYIFNRVDDYQDRQRLKEKLADRPILLIAPGYSLVEKCDLIRKYKEKVNPVVIGVNFIPPQVDCDFVFYSNRRRVKEKTAFNSIKLIVTSNVLLQDADYRIDYNSVAGAFDQGCNSFVMVLKLLKDIGIDEIAVAGADGYYENNQNYYDTSIRNYEEHGERFNHAVVKAIHRLRVKVRFITPSAYDERNL